MAHPPKSSASLRALIEKCLPTDTDLEAFCLDIFPEVKRRFGVSQDHLQKVNLLIEIADHEVLGAELLRRHSISGKNFSSKQNHEQSSVLRRLIFIILLMVAGSAVALISFGFKYLLAIRDVAGIDIKNRNPDREAEKEVLKTPTDFASSIEHIAIEKIGAMNTLIISYREFDTTQKSWMRGIMAIDKRNNRTVAFMLIPETEVKSWVSSLSLRQPWVREVIMAAIRVSDKSLSPNLRTTESAEVKASQESKAHKTEREQEKNRVDSSDAHDRKKPTFKETKRTLDEPSITPPPDMQSIDLLTIPQSPIEAVKPKIVPAAFLSNMRLYNPVPSLPQEIREQWLCSKFMMLHKICIKNDGAVSNVETIKSITNADNEIKNILQQWKFKPRENPVCFINSLSYQVDDGNNCEKAEIELPGWSSIQDLDASKKEKTVPMIIIKKDKIAGVDPHLPDIVKAGNRGKVISGSYKVCISTGGVIYKVEVISSIPKADQNIVKTVYAWKYRPQIMPICFMQFFEFHIE